MNLYLDIDGVLLTRKQKIPKGLHQFLRFVTQNFDCFWLTTHCRAGENKAVAYLSAFFSDEVLALLQSVKSTDWHTLKTEAIDFSRNFIWLDDAPFNAEKQILSQQKKLHCLWTVDLKNENELQHLISKFEDLVL